MAPWIRGYVWCDFFSIRSTMIETLLLRMRTTNVQPYERWCNIVSSYKDTRSYDDFERDVETSQGRFEVNAICYLQPHCLFKDNEKCVIKKSGSKS